MSAFIPLIGRPWEAKRNQIEAAMLLEADTNRLRAGQRILDDLAQFGGFYQQLAADYAVAARGFAAQVDSMPAQPGATASVTLGALVLTAKLGGAVGNGITATVGPGFAEAAGLAASVTDSAALARLLAIFTLTVSGFGLTETYNAAPGDALRIADSGLLASASWSSATRPANGTYNFVGGLDGIPASAPTRGEPDPFAYVFHLDATRGYTLPDLTALVQGLLARADAWLAQPVVSPPSVIVEVAAPALITGIVTPLKSDTGPSGRMLGPQCQRREWQTDDGALHVIYNVGSLNGAGNSLVIASSYDGGRHWEEKLSLPLSGPSSTGDGVIFQDHQLWYTYGANDGTIRVVRLAYCSSKALRPLVFGDPASFMGGGSLGPPAGSWAISISETAVTPGTSTLDNPSVAVDGANTVWVGYLVVDAGGNNNLTVTRRTGGSTYVASTRFFGTSDATAPPERSICLVAIPGGVGAIYPVRGTINWAVRHNVDATTAAWTSVALYTDDLDLDNYNAGFSVAPDADRNLHFAYSFGGALLYFRWDVSTHLWTALPISPAIGSAFPQVTTTSSGKVWIFTQDQYATGQAFMSADGGASFDSAAVYQPPTLANVSFPAPRIQAPVSFDDLWGFTVPLLMQFTDSDSLETLLAF